MNMRTWIKTYVLSLRKDIVILLIVDLLFLFIMEVFLRSIPAPFPVFVKIGDFFVTLAISFVASFIFYFAQIHMPNVKEKNDLYPSIAILFNRIINAEKALLVNYVNVKQFKNLTEDIIRQGAEDRDVSIQDAPLILAGPNRHANWMEYGFHQLSDIDKNWSMIMQYSSYLDSRCLSIMARIQEDSVLMFFRNMRSLYNSVKFGKLSGMSSSFVKFWNMIREQEEYYNAIFAEHQKRVSQTN